MRACESCGARNSPRAQWCGQCLRSFAAPVVAATAPPPAESSARSDDGARDVAPALRLATGTGRTMGRVTGWLLVVGGVVVGPLATLSMLLFMHIMTLVLGGSVTTVDVAIAVFVGAVLAAGSIVAGIASLRIAGHVSSLDVAAGHLTIRYPGFRSPVVVPRELVRRVAVDPRSRAAAAGERFPVAGEVPEDVFADALDTMARDFPSRRLPLRVGPGVSGDAALAPAVQAVQPDEPVATLWGSAADEALPGWASVGSRVPWRARRRPGHLWRGDGSALPFARLNPEDAPNVALLFHSPVSMPRAPRWFLAVDASPAILQPVNAGLLLRGPLTARGLLLRLQDPAEAERSFGSWGVLGAVTAQDVLDSGLLLPKPLRGVRALVFGLAVLALFGFHALVRMLS